MWEYRWKRPSSGHERNDSLVQGSKSVSGPTGGQGTAGRPALSAFLITMVSIGFAEDIFSVQVNSQKNLWPDTDTRLCKLEKTLGLDFFHLYPLPTNDEC